MQEAALVSASVAGILKMKCVDCDDDIPSLRLKIKPGVTYCVKCADNHEPVVVCRMIYPHKTGGELFVASGSENIRRLNNEYKRAR